MREILFRGKRVDSGEWVYGWPFADTAECSLKESGKCVCPHDGSEFYVVEWDDAFHEYEERQVDPATVGQYAGLVDKNGKRIFEGDLVVSTNKRRLTNKPYEVKFCPLSRFWMCDPEREPLVVGNVHDNQELLKGGMEYEEANQNGKL